MRKTIIEIIKIIVSVFITMCLLQLMHSCNEDTTDINTPIEEFYGK